MNTLMTVVAASVCVVSFSGVVAAGELKSEIGPAGGVGQEEPAWFGAGAQVDLNTAYIWRNTVQTDKLVLQPCAWIDFTRLEQFYFGFLYWQDWDLSSDRKAQFKRRLNESDYNLHAGVTAWENDDNDMSLNLEGGHEWYTYHFTRREAGRSTAPSTRELYLKAIFDNPIVGVYGQGSWLYDEIGEINPGFYYEIGLNKEFGLCDVLTLGLDWNTSFSDEDYSAFITGYEERGFLGTTIKAYLSWAVTDWMSLVGSVAYTGILNPNTRDDYTADGERDGRDIIWGGVSAKFEF